MERTEVRDPYEHRRRTIQWEEIHEIAKAWEDSSVGFDIDQGKTWELPPEPKVPEKRQDTWAGLAFDVLACVIIAILFGAVLSASFFP